MASRKKILNDWKFRHLGSLLLIGALIWAFWLLRPDWSPMHRWNRAFGDASFLAILLVMVLGPAARIWRRLTIAMPWRRELGVWGFSAALVHAGFILFGWVDLEWQRLFGLEFHPELLRYVMFDKGLGFGSVIGMLALIYGLALAMTSNDLTQRWMGMPIWKFFQQGAYILWALIVVHTAYFLFMHFLDFHRQTPEPNPVRWPFVVLVGLVMAMQTTASMRTWRRRRVVHTRVY
ncbi:MAG: ferric reductase-like transmembrane domain-containing protein [Paracoccaceae bacterium]